MLSNGAIFIDRFTVVHNAERWLSGRKYRTRNAAWGNSTVGSNPTLSAIFIIENNALVMFTFCR